MFCHSSQGYWQKWGTAGPGAQLLSPNWLAFPLCLFLSCASAFHLCPFLFTLLSFPLNEGKKNNSHRTQRIAKGNKPRIICLAIFYLFFLSSFLFSFCKIWPSEFSEVCIYLESQMWKGLETDYAAYHITLQ